MEKSNSNVTRKNDLVFYFLLPFLGATTFVLSLYIFLLQPFVIPSASMANTLNVGDRVVAWKKNQTYSRGDVIVFRDDMGWLDDKQNANGEEEEYIVKRVIAVGGDTVTCCTRQGNVTVNGEEVIETYIKENSVNTIPFRVSVPAGHLFVLGDNREMSADSRYHLNENGGAINEKTVVGKVFWKLSPQFNKVQ